MSSTESSTSVAAIIARCRIVLGALAFAPLIVAGVLAAVDLRAQVGPLALPAAIFGAIAPVVSLRQFGRLRSRVAPGVPLETRGEHYLTALLVAVGITEAAAFAGVLISEFTGEPLAMLGLATHLVLVGVVWPNEERFAAFHGERGP
jgi:hypothetical protein